MEATGKKLDFIMRKKNQIERNLVTSFVTHLVLICLDILLIACTIKIIGTGSVAKIMLGIALAVFTSLVMYLTSVSFIERIEAELRSFYHYTYILLHHGKEAAESKKEINFVGYTRSGTETEEGLDEILQHVPSID